MLLNNKIINGLTPSDKATASRPDKVTDGNGLQLLVRVSGTKTWIASYYWNGKNQNITIGRYPAISLKEARQRNVEIRQKLQKGINPRSEMIEQKRLLSGEYLFKSYASKYHALQETKVKAGTYNAMTSLYERHIAPELADKAVTAITPLDVLAMARKTAKTSGNEQASRAVRQARKILTLAVIEATIKTNPADDITSILPTTPTTHRARIEARELPRLLADIKGYKGHSAVKIGLLLLAHTFVRVSELVTAEWHEFDFNREIWTIPAHKMKMGREHVVPLTPQVISLLNELKQINGGKSSYLFYNPETGSHYTRASLTNALHRIGYKGQMTSHGFRGLASTTLHNIGQRHEIIELQLAHVTGNAVSRAYNSAQQLLDRRKLMLKWSAYLNEQENKHHGNVIAFTAERNPSDAIASH